ncbi:MAG: nitroreductase family protein [Halobacteriota archaeon]
MAPSAVFNVAISVEHIVLRALDFGLGTCWIRLFDEHKIRAVFGWDERTHVVVLLPVGYPAEAPAPRPRRALEEIILE